MAHNACKQLLLSCLHENMAFKSREKKPFSSCIQGIREEYLRRPVCHDVYGDLNFQPEIDWILPKCAERDTIRTLPFCESLGLSEDEGSAVIRASPRSKEQQLRQAVFAWSKRKSDEATLEKLLEALYISDEVELVESICQDLLSVNISDERKAEPQEVYAFDHDEIIKPETVHHKAVQEEEETATPSISSIDRETGPFLKPVRVSSSDSVKSHLPRRQSSDQDVVKPVSATDTEHGQFHSVMAWPTQKPIPGHLLHNKELQLPSESSTSSSAIQVEDDALEKSVTFQGEMSRQNMPLEARMNRLEYEMIEMREESRKEDEKLRCQIEELKNELRKKDLEIQHLKGVLKVEAEQKQEAMNQLDLERKLSLASSEELKRKLENLKKQLQERDAQIEVLLKRKESHARLVEEDSGADCFDGKEYVHSNSEEDTSVVTNPKFEETKVLGYGNFGIVFKGLCQDTGRELAVKSVKDLNDKTIKSLDLEYSVLSKLRHKRIVSYLGVCYELHPTYREECLFIMTEFMPGGSLADFYKEKGALNETLTRRYTRQILQGVEYLHRENIVHRDIKGSNIMRDTCGHVKLADFGSAKKIFSETSEKNRTSYLYGTAPWAAPEILRGESAQSQSDIWSVAATVVEMMTAEHPYKSDPIIKDRRTIVYLVGIHKLTPLLSVSVKELINCEKITKSTLSFLTECFKSVADERPAASDLLASFNFCQKDTNP